MAELKLEHIKKTYDNNNTVVKDFNLHITDKEFIVFVGPSGCGKSTTLRMVAGLESITSGDFYIDGERMNDVEPKNRDIAMVFQNYALYPHMTVFENMAFGLKLRKVNKKEIEQKVNEAAEILGLTEYLGRKPKALSGGQRQRVALGRAIVRDAKVFLMDEPLSNLDAKLASGGSDDTREGTVMGGEVLVIRKQPLPYRQMYDSDGFRLYFNDVQLPLLADQVRWMHDKYWVDESVVRIIFPEVSAHIEDLRSYENAGENYIDIAWLARKYAYQVTLKDDGLYLTDDTYTSVKRNTNAYYRYDRDSITR